jgi:glycosyltransferase involved in cell wall biosynthesis
MARIPPATGAEAGSGMRVVLLVTDLQPGGTPLRVARIARGLQARGVRVHVASLSPPGPVTYELMDEQIPTYACNAFGPTDLSAVARLAKFVRQVRCRVLHASLFHANIAARLAALPSGARVLTSTVTIEVERPWHLWLERLTARWDDGHIVNSRTLADHVVRQFRRPRSRVHIVPPLINAPRDLPDRAAARERFNLAPHERAVLWFGRLDPVKRVDLVIQTAEAMTGQPTHFWIVGDGPERANLEQLLRLSSAQRNTTLFGWQGDLRPYLAAADALLFPSLTEGLPNAVLEARAAGLPVVGSDIAPLRELAASDPAITLVSDPTPKRLADALAGVLSRERPGSPAHLPGPNAAIDALLAIYERVLTTR